MCLFYSLIVIDSWTFMTDVRCVTMTWYNTVIARYNVRARSSCDYSIHYEKNQINYVFTSLKTLHNNMYPLQFKTDNRRKSIQIRFCNNLNDRTRCFQLIIKVKIHKLLVK